MRLTYLAYTFSLVMKHFSIALFIPIIIALWFKEYSSIPAFIIAGISALIVASLIKRIVPDAKNIKTISMNMILMF